MSRCPLAGRALSTLGLALLAPSALAQTIKLSGPLARPIGGDVVDYAVSPDQRLLVYVADEETDDVFELFATKINGGGRIKLSGPLTAGGDVTGKILVSPDGRRVLYRTDQETDELFELYAVPISGGVPIELSGGLDVDTSISSVSISSAGERVVFLAGNELYGVPVDGSARPVKLNGPLVAGGRVLPSPQISPDGRWCVYLAYQENVRSAELYSAPTDGSAPARKLNGPLVRLGTVSSFEIDPASRRVLYLANQDSFESMELFSATIDGRGEPSKINGALALGGHVRDFRIDSAGKRVVFLAQQQDSAHPSLWSPRGIYSAPLDGARPPTKLNENFPNLADDVTAFSLDPTGERVVYRLTLDPFDKLVSLLFSVPIDGSQRAIRLSDVPVYESGVTRHFEIGADGKSVVYADWDPAGFLELYAVPIDGSADPVELGGAPLTLDHSPAYDEFRISPDGKHVVYLTDHGTDGHFALFRVPIDAGEPPTKLGGEFVFGGNVFHGHDPYHHPVGLISEPFVFSAGGRRVIYLADQEADEAIELFSVVANGTKLPVKLNGTLPLGPVQGDAWQFSITPDGGRAVYLADQELDNQSELFSVRLDGGAAPVKLNAPLAEGSSVWYRLRITSDGARVVYLARHRDEDEYHLHAVPTDGSSAPLDLCGPLPHAYLDFSSYELSPDGLRLVYEAALNGGHELFSVPVDGSERPVKLNGPLVGGGGVIDFRISPDGQRVVYRAVQDNPRDEVYSVDLRGGAAPVRLNPDLVQGGSVSAFAIAPGGLRVVYLADQEMDELFELYSVPIDGGASAVNLSAAVRPFSCSDFQVGRRGRVVFEVQEASPALYGVPISGSTLAVRISDPLVAGRDITQFELGPDGRVAYVADRDFRTAFELFSAPSDGSLVPMKLNGPLVVQGDVFVPFRISPDGTRVVYLANPENRTIVDLHGAPIDASTPSAKLSLWAGFGTQLLPDFRISADSSSILYRVSLDTTAGPEAQSALLRASIDGSRPPALVVDPPRTPTSYGVSSFEPTSDGTRVVYTADLDFPGVLELYVTVLPALR